MDQTHVMYYYWQQPMTNTYVDHFAPYLSQEADVVSQDATSHEGAAQEASVGRCYAHRPRRHARRMVTGLVPMLVPYS